MGYKDTLLPYPYLQQNCKYGIHEVLQHFYSFQIGDFIIHQTLCFVHWDFYLWVFWYNYQFMLTRMNAYIWHIFNIHNHTQIFIGQSYYWVGVVIFYVSLNHLLWCYLLRLLPPSVPLIQVGSLFYYIVILFILTITTFEITVFLIDHL